MTKRFYRLCQGPFDGRTISPGTPDYPRDSAAGNSLLLSVFPAASVGEAQRRAPSNLVHVYEPFDRIDEIWLEIVLCKYVGTRPSDSAGLNLTPAA